MLTGCGNFTHVMSCKLVLHIDYTIPVTAAVGNCADVRAVCFSSKSIEGLELHAI